MSRTCLSVEALRALLLDDNDDAVATLLLHARSCARCRTIIDAVRTMMADADDVTTERIRYELAVELQDVEEAIAALIREPTHRWALLAREPERASEAGVRRLIALARECVYRDRGRFLLLTEAAVSMAEVLEPDTDAVRLLRVDAWKNRSTALYFVSRIADALEALDAAEDALQGVQGAVRERAELMYAKAWLLSQPDVWRMDEAADLAMQAGRVFAETEPARTRDAMHLLAVIHLRLGDDSRALQLLTTLWCEPSAVLAPHAQARERAKLSRNLSQCYMRSGDLAEAERIIAVAMELDTADGEIVALAFDRWIRGQIAITGDRFDQAVPDLEFARRVFNENAMPDYCLRVRVHLVEAALGQDRDADVRADCAALVNESMALDAAEPSRTRSFTIDAMQFLSDQATARALTAECVAEVAAYLAVIHASRPTPFVRPLPSRIM